MQRPVQPLTEGFSGPSNTGDFGRPGVYPALEDGGARLLNIAGAVLGIPAVAADA